MSMTGSMGEKPQMSERLCPRCFLPMPSSDVLCARSHNGKTIICSTCGQIESLEKLAPGHAEGLIIAQRRAQAARYGLNKNRDPKLPKGVRK